MKRLHTILVLGLIILSAQTLYAQQKAFQPAEKFHAIGTEEPVVANLKPGWPVPRELERVAVELHFDLLPTKMRFSMPCYPSMVTENNIHFSNGWTETYDPNASSSCEVLWDREARYARMWIESQNPARIIVRVRAAISDPEGYIGHSDIPSGSPYGKGDWTDEWYYIYPDGTHTRHVRIYSGVASQSLTVTDQSFDGAPASREIPPMVVHEFQEDFIFGLDGHIPTDDIDKAPITLIYPDATHKTFSYEPYLKGFGDFTLANIKVINTKSRYKPFTISMPYGIKNETYPPEGDLPFVFQTWGGHDDEGYSTSLGHTLNWWHYRRTDKVLEQVYLSGFVTNDHMVDELVELERSWIIFPRLLMEGLGNAYTQPIYRQEQKAYVIPGDHQGAKEITFTLGFPDGDDELPLPVQIVNPVFVLKNWGEMAAEVKVDGKLLNPGDDFRIGYEKHPGGTDLIIWVDMKSSQSVRFSVKPK